MVPFLRAQKPFLRMGGLSWELGLALLLREQTFPLYTGERRGNAICCSLQVSLVTNQSKVSHEYREVEQVYPPIPVQVCRQTIMGVEAPEALHKSGEVKKRNLIVTVYVAIRQNEVHGRLLRQVHRHGSSQPAAQLERQQETLRLTGRYQHDTAVGLNSCSHLACW